MSNLKQSDLKNMTKNELLLMLGRLTSKIGNIIFDYANQILLVNLFQSRSYILAIYQGGEVILSSVFNMIGGVVSDISEKKRLVILTDLLSAGICFLTGILIHDENVAIIVILANAILAVINSFNSPTYKSIVRELVMKERVHIYNAMSNAGYEIISIIAPLIGLALVNYVGVQGALYFDGLTFLGSAVIEVFFKSIYPKASSKQKKFKQEFFSGLCYIKSEKEILSLIVISSLVNFVLAGYNLFTPYTENIYKNICPFFYSKVMISEAIGSIIGAYLTGKTKDREKNIWQLIFGIGISFIIIPVFKILPTVFLKLIPYGLCGILATMYNISYVSLLQVRVDINYQGRVFGIVQALATIFMPLGSFAFSILPLKCESFYIIGIIMVLVGVGASFMIRVGGREHNKY